MDGYGDSGRTFDNCYQLMYQSSVDGDCDDDNSMSSPATAEICDGVDNDCDGAVDEGACGMP